MNKNQPQAHPCPLPPSSLPTPPSGLQQSPRFSSLSHTSNSHCLSSSYLVLWISMLLPLYISSPPSSIKWPWNFGKCGGPPVPGLLSLLGGKGIKRRRDGDKGTRASGGGAGGGAFQTWGGFCQSLEEIRNWCSKGWSVHIQRRNSRVGSPSWAH